MVNTPPLNDSVLRMPEFMFVSRDWRVAAACRDSPVEMVPGVEGSHAVMGSEVLAAKTVCGRCRVKEICLQNANGSPGVWGGLTQDERERLRMSQRVDVARPTTPREIIECQMCGLDCVPRLRDIPKCDSCLTEVEKPKSVEAFKPNIIAMIEGEGATYRAAAERFGLRKEAVGKACRRWKVQSRPGRHVGTPNSEDDLAPCGSPAAKRRHERRGEPIKDCACARPGSSNPNKTRRNKWAPAA